MSTTPAYEGEARLIRWADSGGAGRTVTLQIDESSVEHPFKHLPWGSENGQRMAIVCMLVNDDEEPIGPDQAKANAKRHKARTKSKAVPVKPEPVAEPEKAATKRSSLAAIKCADPSFRTWFLNNHSSEKARARIGLPLTGDITKDEAIALATHSLRDLLGIHSRRELDEPGPAADAFDKLLASYDYRNQVRA